MEIIYASEKLKAQCTSVKAAKKLFGGNESLVKALLSRVNAISHAEIIKDIILNKAFRFHALSNKGRKDYEGYFSIDVKSIREPWRLILQPLDQNKHPFHPCNIDEIASIVKIVEIKEVSNHYE